MLPGILRGPGRVHFEASEWKSYLERLGSLASVDREFLRQVPYDHFDHFNEYYPWFDIRTASFRRIMLTSEEVSARVRYFEKHPVEMWGLQFDEYLRTRPRYIIFERMSAELTWPFPPILLENTNGRLKGLGRNCGQPLHLIEGTHRVSYLCRMLELGQVPRLKKHEAVLVTVSSLAQRAGGRSRRPSH